MISDDFWEDPDLADLAIEERCALLLFLTSKKSNIIGIYRLIWRQIGAGSGWTEDQIITTARKLKSKGCIDIEEASGWVWVKSWWKHNSLPGAFTGKVASKAQYDVANVPEFWRQAVLEWIAANDNEGAYKPLPCPLQGADANPIPSPNSISTITTNGCMVAVGVDESEDIVEAAIWAARTAGKVRSESGFKCAVKKRILSNGANPMDLESLRAWRVQRAREVQKDRDQQTEHKKEILDKKRALEATERIAEVEICFESLSPAERGELLQAFSEHLGANNKVMSKSYSRNGLAGELVRRALWAFIMERSMSEFT